MDYGSCASICADSAWHHCENAVAYDTLYATCYDAVDDYPPSQVASVTQGDCMAMGGDVASAYGCL